MTETRYERNRRAREYSRRCHLLRWRRRLWAVAVDPDIIPLGSTVTLGGKEYIAADTGVYGYTVDVLMSHEDAAQAGVVKAVVKFT